MVLGKKAGRGVQGYFRPVCLMSDISVLPSMDLTPAFTRTQGQQEISLEGQMLQRGIFKGFKGTLCQLVQYQGEVAGGDAPLTLKSVSVEAIQETSEIFIFADIDRRIP